MTGMPAPLTMRNFQADIERTNNLKEAGLASAASQSGGVDPFGTMIKKFVNDVDSKMKVSAEEILRLFVVNEFRRCGLTGSNILIRARVVGHNRGIIIRRNIDDCFREKRGLAVHRRILG